jgi:tetratricopeptide (TPR) repeat protein
VTRDMERKRQQGRAEDALKLLRRRAVLLMRLGKEEAAIQDWKQYLSSTNDPWAHRDLASLYLFGAPPVRDFQAAKDEAGAAVSLERKNPDNHFRLGVACFRTGDYQTGLDHLQEAARLRVDKANAENLFYQAMCCFKLDRIEQATVIHARAAQAAQAEYAGREAPASLTQLKAEAKRLFGK